MKSQKIYLLRHGAIQEPGEETLCIGHTDLALTQEGRAQALRLKEYFRNRPVAKVSSSPLLRCIQTAEVVFPQHKIHIEDQFIEQYCGEWENLPFSKLKKEYREYFRLRGESLVQYPPLGGETLSSCLDRMKAGLESALEDVEGNIVIIAHATVNRVLLADLLEMDLDRIHELDQPPSCISEIGLYDTFYQVESVGRVPHTVPDDEEIESLWNSAGIGESAQKHCRMVASLATAMATAVSDTEEIEPCLLSAAAKLHDIARNQPKHPLAAQRMLERNGFPLLGEIVASHHNLNRKGRIEISAAFLLNLADKYCLEDQVVPLKKRFDISLEKCKSEEATLRHRKRYQDALEMENVFKKIARIGREIPDWFKERGNVES